MSLIYYKEGKGKVPAEGSAWEMYIEATSFRLEDKEKSL